jgi:hypothetical protein
MSDLDLINLLLVLDAHGLAVVDLCPTLNLMLDY